MTQHTPTPWIAQDNQITDTQDRMICPLVQAYDVKDGAYASGSQLKAVDDGGASNAAFIVQACNSYDALVEKLEVTNAMLEQAISSIRKFNQHSVHLAAMEKQVKDNDAALALAKVES